MMANDLAAMRGDHESGHSEYQMDRFITCQAGGTVYGMYLQALRELFSRHDVLVDRYFARAEMELDSDLTDAPATAHDPTENARAELRRARKRVSMQRLNESITATEREFARFYSQAVALRERLGDSLTSDRESLEREYWIDRLESSAAVDVLCTGRIGAGTREAIRNMNPADRGAVCASVLCQETLVNRWLEHRPIDIEALVAEHRIDVAEVPALVNQRKLLESTPCPEN